MSRLWPETITVGLFPGDGGSWLRRGGETVRATPGAHADPRVDTSGPQHLLAALGSLLAEPARPWRKGSRVRLLVSDSAAAVTVLPWQELLSSDAELRAYAQSCFGRQGLQIGGDWTLQTGFRHFRSAGLAYALPQAWMEALLDLLGGHGLRLASVLPLSAAAYWRASGARASALPDVLLLRERGRLTAQVRQGRHLLSMDVQPAAGNEDQALLRLLRRVGATHPAVARVDTWCASGEELAAGEIAACFPDAQRRALPHRCWS